ncbi:alkaline phosphatase family protein [Luteitalea pratensis]|uniref:alkaline phosphatase family protein n=1 Tax=Luteitalea pratensis TaxID=1855912 RepID=UPI0012FFAC4E|nr:alkaline phosphatase family protein [Luteitalea pratensis]
MAASPGAQVAGGPGAPASQTARFDAPAVRLVLLIAVDQFRPDYLSRFGPPEGGLKTLLTRGAVFTSAYLEHGTTVTAVGHSTMLTGSTPAVSGIIENTWYERATKTTVESITDSTVQIVGAAASGGVGASPRRLLVPTLGDQIKMASAAAPGTPLAPRVIGISLKDRSAILPAGHAADAAYFFRGGRFVTSTYYRPALPAWVEAVNARRIADTYAGKQWTFDGGAHAYPATTGAALDAAVAASPAGNELVLAVATAALEHEQLGQRGVTDVLTVSFSANDSVGHAYGPESPEVRDITHQTDRQLQTLLDEVERRVGLRQTLIAFTADHGVAPRPEAATALRIPGGRFPATVVSDAIESALVAKYGAGPWIEKAPSLANIYLDVALIDGKGLDRAEVRRVAAEAVSRVPHVARVYTRDAILSGAVPRETISERITRGYHRDRSGDLHVLLEPHWIAGGANATHGTPYGYDAHIPLILMGPGIVPGRYRDHVALQDLAQTLAAVLEVEPPSGAQGRVLAEALRTDGGSGANAADPAAAGRTPPAHRRNAP